MHRLVPLLGAMSLVYAADQDGAALYKQRCAACHDVSGQTRAPNPAALHQMSPEFIVRALESGAMQDQGASLTAAERRTVAEFLTGKTVEEGPAMNPRYECCSGRGALVALEVATGKQIWKTYTIAEEPHVVGTGDNFSDPGTKTSDAVLAFDIDTGKIAWSKQLTEADVFNMAGIGPSKASCPEKAGPDLDIGASPILVNLAQGKRALLVSQKSGIVHALDPDRKGEILWETRVGRGGALGGIQWGSAADGKNMYVALSDIAFSIMSFGSGSGKLVVDPKAGGGLFALDLATGKKVWAAPPPPCGERLNCSPAQSAAITVIPGVVFSGSVDGHLRGYSTRDGSVIWDFDTACDFTTVNGVTAQGGSMDGPGPAISGGMLYLDSGYGAWGGLPGNVLLAFSVDGK